MRPTLIAQGYPAPSLSREAGEGEWSPRPFGERGGGEGLAVLNTSMGQIGLMDGRPQGNEAISFLIDVGNTRLLRVARNDMLG